MLCDNIHDFLVNMELNESPLAQNQYDKTQDLNENEADRVYVLGDGTQIRASQIHFDNDDPPVDLTKETIPFVKHTEDIDEINSFNVPEKETKLHKIVDSPVVAIKDSTNSFANGLPFKLISNNYETQFTKFVASSTKSNIWREKVNVATPNNTKYSTRAEILEMLKDNAVDVKPHDVDKPVIKRKHARKSDPTKLEPICRLKRLTNVNETQQPKTNNHFCNFCGVLIENEKQKFSMFDKGSTEKILNINTLNASLAQLKKHAPIKTICIKCLDHSFVLSQISLNSPNDQNRLLDPDEYIVMNDNQQYVYRKTKNITCKNIPKTKEDINNNSFRKTLENNHIDNLVKDLAQAAEEKRNKVLNENKSNNKDKEKTLDLKLETNQHIEEYVIEDATVLELFEENNHCSGDKEPRELKCRFCNRVFCNISELDSHASDHCLTIDDEELFPCPLCDYGYSDLMALREHLKTHESPNSVMVIDEKDCIEKEATSTGEIPEKENKEKEPSEQMIEVKTEVKVEEGCSSDEEGVWIVQTMDDGGDDGLVKLLGGAADITHNDKKCKGQNKDVACNSDPPKTIGTLVRCARLKSDRGGDHSMARRVSNRKVTDKGDSHVTCHDCNERFTSKVRLRFHLQFHATSPKTSSQLTADGRFSCPACPNATFDTDSQLFDHVHFQHTRERDWKCRVRGCGKSFHLKATLTKHGRAHTDTRRYICGDCGKRFLDKQTLDEHGVTHLKIKPYKCHICLKQLTRRSRLRMHLRAHLEEPSPKLVAVCRRCHQAFRDHTAAQDHVESSVTCVQELAEQLKQRPPQLSPSSGLVTRPVFPRGPPPIKWQVNSLEASQLLSRLTVEARALITVVEIDKALRCEYCELVFYTEQGLNNHRAIHQGVANPYICHICKVSFSTYSRCTTHKTTHGFFKRPVSRQAEHSAPVLGYSDFPVVKHFLCEVCGRSYLHWTYLQVHRRNKHPPRGIALSCSKCHLSFSNSRSLTIHKKSAQCNSDHDDSCVVYDTGEEDSAVKHHDYGNNTSVTGAREREGYRIKCRDCEAVLPSKTALYRHRNKAHCDQSLLLQNDTDDVDNRPKPRPWGCDQCPRHFRVRAELRAHGRACHPDLVHVIQMSGCSPRPQQALVTLLRHGISTLRVRSVAAISYTKGSTGILPDCPRALRQLGDVAIPVSLQPPRESPQLLSVGTV